MERNEFRAGDAVHRWSNKELVREALFELAPLLSPGAIEQLEKRYSALLHQERSRAHRAMVDVDGIRGILFQIVRNRDPEMKLNHVTELNLATVFSLVADRTLGVERRASPRNERCVDFGLEDPDHLFLVEVKNLNRPLIKKASDPAAERLRHATRGTRTESDAQIAWLFFRQPRSEDMDALERDLVRLWNEQPHGSALPAFLPVHRPRAAVFFTPARADTGGRVIVYDHGDQLMKQPGAQIRAVSRNGNGRPPPRERLEELCAKDNFLRRLQDAEGKFPLNDEKDAAGWTGALSRVVIYHAGDWVPTSRMLTYMRDACAWYLNLEPSTDDFWRGYYGLWAQRWKFRAHHNVDAVIALEGDGIHHPYRPHCLFARREGIVARLFPEEPRRPPAGDG